MPSLNSDKIHHFTDVYEAKPFPVRIIYENSLRFPLVPYGNGWSVVWPTAKTDQLSKSRQKYLPNYYQFMLFRERYNFY